MGCWVRKHLGTRGEKVAQASSTLKELLAKGQTLDLNELQKKILAAVKKILQIELEEAPLTPEEEQELAGMLK